MGFSFCFRSSREVYIPFLQSANHCCGKDSQQQVSPTSHAWKERWQLRIYIYICWSMYIYTAYIEIVYHRYLYNMYIYILLYLLCYIETYLMSQTPLEAIFWQKPSWVLRWKLVFLVQGDGFQIPTSILVGKDSQCHLVQVGTSIHSISVRRTAKRMLFHDMLKKPKRLVPNWCKFMMLVMLMVAPSTINMTY